MPWRLYVSGGLASRPWLIVPTCAAMHATYAIGFLTDRAVGGITALALIHTLFGDFCWIVLFAVAVIALAPMIIRMHAVCVHFCLWPQQTALFLMAASALVAAYNGRYPDGIERSFIFIFTDQCYAVFLTAAHLAATIRNARIGKYGHSY